MKILNRFKSNLYALPILFIPFVSFQANAVITLFELNDLKIVITPDGPPIIWENEKKFGVDFTYDVTLVNRCTGICSSKAFNAGGVNFRIFQVSQYITITVYYDVNGKIVATEEIDSTPFVPAFASRPETGITNSTVVGSLPGELSVSPSGASSYTVPVEIPKGISGMKPSVSVVYDSQTGSSELGQGWSLSTSSSISRCPKTIAQDGQVSGVNYIGFKSNSTYSSFSKFCLDGQRLMAVNGNYGDNGTEYRLEKNNDIKIISYGQTGRATGLAVASIYKDSGPEKFIAYYKNGSFSEYGYTEDSRIQKTGANGVRTWLINKTTDQFTNYMTYLYTEDNINGDYHISQIDFSGNIVNNVLPESSVKFIYEDRYDKYLSFNSGAQQVIHSRLRKIETYVNTSKLLTYNFYYKNVNNEPVRTTLLSSIEKCSADGCMNSTNFEWQGKYGNTGVPDILDICENGETANGVCNDWDNYSSIRYPDIDNDGLSDICYRGDQGIQCRITNHGAELNISTNICANGSKLYGVCNDVDNHNTIQYIDINADGKKDIVYRGDRGVQAHIWNGAGFTYLRNTSICANGASACNDIDNHYSIKHMDINADAYSDMCYRSDKGIKCHLGSASGWGSEIATTICANGSSVEDGVCNDGDNYDTINYVDISGDAKLELVYRSDNGIRISFWSRDSGFGPLTELDVCKNGYPDCNNTYNHDYIQYPDINGDGLSDLCYIADSGIKCHYSNGLSFNQSADIATNICSDSSAKLYGVCNDVDNFSSVRFADLNADGLSDLIVRTDDRGIQLFLFDGNTFVHKPDSVLNSLCSNGSVAGGVCNDRDNHQTISFADFNGDGESDFVYRSDRRGIIRYVQNDYTKPLITRITNGFGVKQNISYKPITDSSVYNYATGAIYPAQDVQYPLYVVSEQSNTDGLSGTVNITYQYGQARVNLHGRGSLGFGWTESTNSQTGLVTRVNYNQAYPYTGLVNDETQTLNGNLLSFTENTPATFQLGNGRVLTYLAKKVVKAYGINGLQINSVTSVNKINNNGDIIDVIVTTQNANDTSETYNVYTHNEYAYSDSVDFNLQSLVTTSSVNKTGPIGASPKVTKTFVYDLNIYKMLSETGSVLDGRNTFAGVSKSYTYDAFGHINSTIISAPDIESRVITTQYGANGQFPISLTNEMGHIGRTSYDPLFGVPLSKTDANGLVTTYQYDNWGVETDVYLPGGNTSHTEKNWCQSACTLNAINANVAPQVVKFSITQSVAGGSSLVKYAPDVTTYFDKLGRQIRTQTTNFKGEIVLTDTAYDTLGRVVAQTQPYFLGSAAKNETITTYDTLNRVKVSQIPGEGTTSVTYNETDFEVTTTRKGFHPITGAEDIQVSSEKKNVIGQILYNMDADGNVLHYEYDAQGNKIKTLMPSVSADGLTVTNLKGTVISIDYDIFGRKIAMNDPNMGNWSYTYDATSKLRSQTDAQGQTTSINYDRLGRMINRVDHDGRKSVWVFNDDLVAGDTPNTMSIGKLDTVYQRDATGFEEYRQNISYTADLGLVDISTTIIEEGDVNSSKKVSYLTQSTYDQYQRPDVVSYPETSANKRLQLKYVYTNGTVTEVNNVDSSVSYWQVKEVDARGGITLADYGVTQANPSGVINQIRGYDDAGRLTLLDYAAGLNTLYNTTYQYNSLGSLVYRKSIRDNTINFLTENYYYDSLQRLTSVDINGTIGAQQYTYDVLGNIRSKTGQGSYQYNNGKPHAVSRVNGSDYIYNNNGAIQSGGGRTVIWSAFNKPDQISNAGGLSSFNYGPSRARYKQFSREYATATEPQKDITTLYVGGSYEKVIESGITKHKHYIKVGGVTIAQHTVEQTATNTVGSEKLEYLLRDNQGSTVAVIDSLGAVIAQMDYDAFGSRRPVLGATGITSVINDIPRGYTGHEHLTKLGLIHMNGRVYDPKLGRFLSADPIIQFSKNIQSYNRFSYVLNNPMSYTDPSGFSLKRLGKAIARASVAIITGGNIEVAYSKPVKRLFLKYEWARAALNIAAGVADSVTACVGCFSSLASAYLVDISGGSLRDVIKSAALSATTSFLGGQVNGGLGYEMLARGAIGAAAAKVTGGSTSNAFWAGALSALGGAKGFNVGAGAYGYITGAIYNGFVAELTGGKFEYGAGSFLFSRMLSDISQNSRQKDGNQNGSQCRNPINVATGEKYLTMLDYQSKGVSKLKFVRHYSSYSKDITSLGEGWRSNFDKKLTFESSVNGQASTVRYIKINREQVSFTKDKNEHWIALDNEPARLQKTDDGWQLTNGKDELETFSEQGRLLSIQHRGGYQQQLNYNAKDQLTEVSDTLGAKIQLIYNRHGLLKAMTDPEGNTTHYRYDMSRQLLSKVFYPDNTKTLADNPYKQYHYDDARFTRSITGITDELNQRVHTMAYDETGRAILSELGDHAERVDITFNNNRSSTVRNSLGRKTTYHYNKDDRTTQVEGHATASCVASNQSYTYDDRGNIETQTSWNGVVTRYSYNDRNLETKRIEAEDTEVERSIETTWHKHYRLPVRIVTSSLTTEFVYNSQGALLEKTEYDTQADVNSLEKLLGLIPSRTTTYSYNDKGLLTQIDGPLAPNEQGLDDITHYRYDDKGNRVQVMNALGHTSHITSFDQNGNPLIVRDTNGLETHLSYNARGWLASKTLKLEQGDATTQYEYAHSGNYLGEGQVSKVTLPNGEQVSYEYDTAYRIIGIANSRGENIHYTLDLEGNRIAETTYSVQGELVRAQQQIFDELSRLLVHMGANQQMTKYQYGKNGQLASITDPLKNQTHQRFDALNRLIASTDANDGVVNKTYDAQNRITAISDQRNLITQYRFNGFGDKIAQISPDTGTTTYAYNPVGKLIAKTDARNVTTEFVYDVIGRLTDIHYANEQGDAQNDNEHDDDIHYRYDELVNVTGNNRPEFNRARYNHIGRLTQVTDQSGQTQYSYTQEGKVSEMQYSIGDTHYRTQNHYSRDGALSAITYPSGRVVNYKRNASGQIIEVNTQKSTNDANLNLLNEQPQAVVNNVHYLPFGPIKHIDYANHTQLNIERDLDYRIKAISLSDSEVQGMPVANDNDYFNVNYAYDKASNITNIADQIDANKSQQFSYDKLYRLTHALGQYGDVQYNYDAVGNRLQRSIAQTHVGNAQVKAFVENYDYAHDSNRLVLVAKHSANDTSERLFNYDAVGNIVNDQRAINNKLALVYDLNNRLKGVNKDQSGDLNVSYLYNAKGQRVSKARVNADGTKEITHFHYDQTGRLLAETNEQGVAINEFIYMANERIAKVEYVGDKNGQLVFIHNDHLGSPKMMTDEFKRVVWTSETLPFGQSLAALNDEQQKLKFPGQLLDGDSGFVYNYFRDYDAGLGRYIQSDPIGLNGGVNTFGYVGGNPFVRFDRYGLTGSDIATALEIIRESQLDLDVPNSVIYGVDRPGYQTGQTDNAGNVYIAREFLEVLNNDQADQLLESLTHEVLHFNQSLLDRILDRFSGHSDVYDDVRNRLENKLYDEFNKRRKLPSCQ